jgi:Tfp pilus assembly protein PilV
MIANPSKPERGQQAESLPHLKKREDGFTLIETMVAFTVLIFGLVALMHLFAVAVMGNLLARTNTFATQAAQEVAEDLKTQYNGWLENMRSGTNLSSDPFPLTGSIQVNVEDPNGATANQTTANQGIINAVYLNRFNVTWNATPDARARYRVDITALPYQAGNSNQPVKLTTYFAP